jgi:hypothetical protein
MKYVAVFQWMGFERRVSSNLRPNPFYHQPVMVALNPIGDFTRTPTSPMTLKLEFEREKYRKYRNTLFIYYRGHLRS